MPLTRTTTLAVTAIAAILIAVVVLREVLFPFVAAMALAYLLDSPVNRLERIGLNRPAAAALIIGSFFLLVIAIVALTAPLIGSKIVEFIDDFPTYVRRLHEFASDPARPWLAKIWGPALVNAELPSGEVEKLAAEWLSSAFNSLWSGGKALLALLSLLIVTPVVTFYLINDWKNIVATIDEWVPEQNRDAVRTVSREIDVIVRSYVQGQSLICLALIIFYSFALEAIGLDHGALIGLVTGLVEFIPYLGFVTGLVLSLFMALMQYGLNWPMIAMIFAIFIVGQFMADYILTPRLIGRRINLNPVWVMFALVAFGYLFGFIGLLIAIPAAAVIGVIARFAFRHAQDPATI